MVIPCCRSQVWSLKFPMEIFGIEFYCNFRTPIFTNTCQFSLLWQIYKSFTDRVNVNIGAKHGHENFFKMNLWNHRPTVKGFYTEFGDCNATLQGATEGALYPMKIQKRDVLWYWRKTLCRPVPLHFKNELFHHSLKAYKFVLEFNVFDRLKNRTADCYQGPDRNLPDGLSDLSRCFYGMFTNLLNLIE